MNLDCRRRAALPQEYIVDIIYIIQIYIKVMSEKLSTLQQALDVVEALEPEEQAILLNVISKRLAQQRRNELIEDVAQARDDYRHGNVKRGSIADLMAELDEWKNLVWSAKFVRKFKRLTKKNTQIRIQIEKTLEILIEDPFDSGLRTHKLKGDLDGAWSCSVDYDI